MIQEFIQEFSLEPKKFNKDIKSKVEILMDILDNDFYKEDVINLAKKNIKIFENLLYLYPLSKEIIEKVLEEIDKEYNGYGEDSFINMFERVFLTSNNIVNILSNLKLKIRKDANLAKSGINYKLNKVKEEIKRHNQILSKLKEYKKLSRDLNILKSETESKDIEDIERDIEKLRIIKQEFQNIKKEIEISKKIFKNLIKDES